MDKKILIIDPFVKQPTNNCFNRLVNLLPAKLFIYQPAFFPMELFTLPIVDAYIVLGSASHIYENLKWHDTLKEFLLSELKNHKPVLGLCFGHQLLSHAFGSELHFIFPDQKKLTGSRTIHWENEKYELGVTHRQGIKQLSPELESIYKYDLIQHKTLPFLGCQAHPEASDQFLTNDCLIADSTQRRQILHDSEQFLIRWYQKFIQIP